MEPSKTVQAWARRTIADYVSSSVSVCGNFQALLRELLPGGEQSSIDAVHLKDDLVYHVPRAVVIGGESAGKSTLMERMTGFPFFPRANRICTRCPVILRMVTDASVPDAYGIDVITFGNVLTECGADSAKVFINKPCRIRIAVEVVGFMNMAVEVHGKLESLRFDVSNGLTQYMYPGAPPDRTVPWDVKLPRLYTYSHGFK